jgi:prepilin signal peptidase PulO-like enzyme (type II secretory pathway)
MLIYVILAVLGLCLGSFVNALVWRVHEQSKSSKKAKNLSIISGRSMCPHCKHELATKDLIPVFSWLFLGGRCRYCQKSISHQYPIVELATALVFILSYVFWPGGVVGHSQWLLFATWIVASVGLMALLIYDFKWMLLPNRILYPTFFVALAGRLAYIALYSNSPAHFLWRLVLSLGVSSGIFYLLFTFSRGRWIGFGDVRLGLITGTVLASPTKSFLMIFLASLLGTIFVLPLMYTNKKSLSAKIPYGPFLITATWLTLLFGPSAINWYKNLLLQ